MSKFKLGFTENIVANHEIIIETDMTEEELNEQLDTVDFGDCSFDDIAYLLEKQLKVNVLETTEGEPQTEQMECEDLDEAD